MNALVKKEIRLLLPSFMVAVLLALVQAITRPYDFYIASLLFFGLTIMALTTIGREASLNTFSLVLAQPAQRIRIWKIKLSVLAVAFLIVLFVWMVAFGIAFFNAANIDADAAENSYNLFITICLIATATFTGGLWTTLLLRQLAGAFWLTLLVPATLSGFSGVFLANSESNNLVIGVLSVVIGIYSITGFLFARWLFFRAQDVGWSGGVISLPEWKFFATRSGNAVSTRTRKPIFALIKKELHLQQVSLIGAAGLLVVHLGVIALRTFHKFPKDSAGEILTSIFWMLWLVMPVILGSIAVAEERKQGVMESQLCLPASRRVQFAIKASLTLFIGILLGGIMPMLLETFGGAIGAKNAMFELENDNTEFAAFLFRLSIGGLAAWLSLVSFFASSLAKNFLQAVGLSIVTFIGSALVVSAMTKGRMFPFEALQVNPILPLVIAVPTLVVTVFWLAYLNYENFREGRPLWRRNLVGMAGAIVFIEMVSIGIYNRAWEIFEPAEPEHGSAIFSSSNPPKLQSDIRDNLFVRLPDGRVWFDNLIIGYWEENQPSRWKELWWQFIRPLPKSAGPAQFIAGSNWISATARRVVWQNDIGGTNQSNATDITGYLDTIGVKSDGTLWISSQSKPKVWTGARMARFGNGTNWQQVGRLNHDNNILLLKTDGTLWLWGTSYGGNLSQTSRPTVWTLRPRQIGTNSDVKEIISGGWWNGRARKADGSVWFVGEMGKAGEEELKHETNFDQIPSQILSQGCNPVTYVAKDGSLWAKTQHQNTSSSFSQVGKETNWVAAASSWSESVALKSDGSLWKWNLPDQPTAEVAKAPPRRLGIHDDWVAIASTPGGLVSLAADGSLWFWPDGQLFGLALMKPSKQPEFLCNIFDKAN